MEPEIVASIMLGQITQPAPSSEESACKLSSIHQPLNDWHTSDAIALTPGKGTAWRFVGLVAPSPFRFLASRPAPVRTLFGDRGLLKIVTLKFPT
jgi:hypothetical protein